MKTLSTTNVLVSLAFIVLAVLGSLDVVSVATLSVGVVFLVIATGAIFVMNARASKVAAMPVIYDNSSR